MREFITVTKALADENRVRILMALQPGELCACQIQELLELAPSTVSKHLSILYQARLVEYRKLGRWVHYRLSEEQGKAYGFIPPTLAWLQSVLADNPTIALDREKLSQIRSMAGPKNCTAP